MNEEYYNKNEEKKTVRKEQELSVFFSSQKLDWDRR